jgi:putative hemolysin
MEPLVPETRGAKPKYNFDLAYAEKRSYANTTPGSLLNSAKSYCKQRGLNWKFRCYSQNGLTHIVRIK